MARKRHTAEKVVNLLRQVEVSIANGKTTGLACKESLITEQTYYRWRKEYGGLQVDQARSRRVLRANMSSRTCGRVRPSVGPRGRPSRGLPGN